MGTLAFSVSKSVFSLALLRLLRCRRWLLRCKLAFTPSWGRLRSIQRQTSYYSGYTYGALDSLRGALEYVTQPFHQRPHSRIAI